MRHLTIKEAANQSGLTTRRIQQMCKSGEIPNAVKENGRWIIPVTFLQNARNPEGETRNLPIGISDYKLAVTDYYYVDKTEFIADFLQKRTQVSLFTRPRRFGKTLNMNMLRVFFEKTDEDTSIYFTDKKIWSKSNRETVLKHQGKYPVIYLTFKDVKFDSWEKAYNNIAYLISVEYDRHNKLLDSPAVSEADKKYFKSIVNREVDESLLAESLKSLSRMLAQAEATPVVIMIDEYDTPIQAGYANGYYNNIIEFIRNLFSGAMKDNLNLAFGFMTGILRVAKESIFSGLNNLKVYSVLDEQYQKYFGFTEDEVKEMLYYYGYPEKFNELKEWYDGYRFGSSDIYNPWSVINYIHNNCQPATYWVSTGDSPVISSLAESADNEIHDNLITLMQGGTVSTYIDTNIIYPDIQKSPYYILSFLLMSGYLKAENMSLLNDGNYMCDVSIPNKEISLIYQKEIIDHNAIGLNPSTALEIQNAISKKDIPSLQKHLENFLAKTISYFDTEQESFYHGLMLGICAVMNNTYLLTSNRESGLGRFDIQLEPINHSLPGFIFELKSAGKTDKSLKALSKEALKQIHTKNYEEQMHTRGINEIICVGVAFSGKSVEFTADNK